MPKNTAATVQDTATEEDRAAYLAFLMGHIDRTGLVSRARREKLSIPELHLCIARLEYEISVRERSEAAKSRRGEATGEAVH